MSQQAGAVKEVIAMSPRPSDPFTDLPRTEWRDVFFGLPEEVQGLLVADMSRSKLETFIDRLDPDEVTEVLRHTDDETREALLATLDSERREKIDFLLSFNPGSAAGLMTLDYVTVATTRSFPEVIDRDDRIDGGSKRRCDDRRQ